MKHQPSKKKKDKPHSFTRQIVGYAFCAHCGLVALKNDVTRKAMREPCPGHDE